MTAFIAPALKFALPLIKTIAPIARAVAPAIVTGVASSFAQKALAPKPSPALTPTPVATPRAASPTIPTETAAPAQQPGTLRSGIASSSSRGLGSQQRRAAVVGGQEGVNVGQLGRRGGGGSGRVSLLGR